LRPGSRVEYGLDPIAAAFFDGDAVREHGEAKEER
jgi:hypothetical protein